MSDAGRIILLVFLATLFVTGASCSLYFIVWVISRAWHQGKWEDAHSRAVGDDR